MAKKNPVYEFHSEEEAIKVLQAEGKRLEQIALKVWRQYLASYKPEMYIRTGKSENGIKLKQVKKIDSDTLGIELTFQDNLMYHDSVFGGSQPKGHSIMLISSGWAVNKGWHRNIPNFGYKEGFNYLGKVVEAFEAVKHEGITLEVQWSGKYLK